MDLKQLILEYEKDFFKKEFCEDRYNLETRIHDQFMEFGQSGCVYNKEKIIQYLISLTADRNLEISDFILKQFDENLVVVHYKSKDKEEKTEALRTSIWKKEAFNWKIYFHQGTPTK